jgi:hypothetical protein
MVTFLTYFLRKRALAVEGSSWERCTRRTAVAGGGGVGGWFMVGVNGLQRCRIGPME